MGKNEWGINVYFHLYFISCIAYLVGDTPYFSIFAPLLRIYYEISTAL